VVKLEEESKQPRLIELLEKEGDRKFMRNSLQKYGNEMLRERKAYVLCHIKKGPSDEDLVENIVIDGYCMRTPEEDVKWEQEQKEKEELAAKGAKKGPVKKK
jgi:hypothetical protein